MATTSQLQTLISKLAKTPVSKAAYNMFSFDDPGNAIRRNNMLLYLEQMAKRKPAVMIVGEAPGYQGSRWTGVNFCSEFIILNGLPTIEMFGKERGYRKTDEWERIWKEPSATIVWKAMLEVKELPLIWAAYPFHPHKPEGPLTNRAPSKEELKISQHFIQDLIKIYGIKKIVAVGNKAEETLTDLGYAVSKVRHPANGGANLFREGIKKHLG